MENGDMSPDNNNTNEKNKNGDLSPEPDTHTLYSHGGWMGEHQTTLAMLP